MPADLPPTSGLEHTVNAVAAELGVGHPRLLDGVATPHTPVCARADACLHLDVAHEARAALAVHAGVGA